MMDWQRVRACMWALICLDVVLFRLVLLDRLINFVMWGITVIGVAGYVLPLFGMSPEYGAFTAVGVLVSAGVFEGYGRIVELVTQMADGKPILYYATLPISADMMILRLMLVNSLRSMVLSLTILPLAKLLLGSGLDLSSMSYLSFGGMFLGVHLFCGACTVWLACKVPSIMGLSNVWMRQVFPFWFLGGFQFSQSALLDAFPVLAWLNFMNPLVYANEGMRAAVLGQNGYLPIPLCVGALVVCTLFCAWRGVVQFKKRLDLI